VLSVLCLQLWTFTHSEFYWLIGLLNTELFILVIVNIVWDPKNVSSFVSGWFIVKAWWLPSRVETCCHSNHNKLVAFDGNFGLLIFSSENTSGWLPSHFVWLFCYYFTAYNDVTLLKTVYFLRFLTTQQFKALLITKDFSSYKFVCLLFYCYWFQGMKIYNFLWHTHLHTLMQRGDLVSLLSVFL